MNREKATDYVVPWNSKCGWTLEQVTAWAKGNWTPQKIAVLEQREDEHIDNCDECQERLKIDPRTRPKNEAYLCPIGDSLLEETSQAEIEYSWQQLSKRT